MMAFVYSFGDVGWADAVSDFAYERSAVAQLVGASAVCSLADSADDGLAWNQDLGSVR